MPASLFYSTDNMCDYRINTTFEQREWKPKTVFIKRKEVICLGTHMICKSRTSVHSKIAKEMSSTPQLLLESLINVIFIGLSYKYRFVSKSY